MFGFLWYIFWVGWTAICGAYAVKDVARGAVDIGIIAPAFLRSRDPGMFWFYIGKRVLGAVLGFGMICLGIRLGY